MRLSIAMIVKNEERNIERCLKAIKKLDNKVDYEIIIVDTGSEDNTLEIARKYTSKVYQHKWNNNFADMRNISISYCKGEWILVLDADEVLEDIQPLVNFFKNNKYKKFNSATIQFKNIISNKDDNYLIASLVRLFKNYREFCYEGRIHEQPKIISPTLITNITVLHYGYSRNDYTLMEYKYERNKKLLIEDLKVVETTKEKIYTYFQLAQTYAMANKIHEATESIYKAFELVKISKEEKRYIYVYHFLGMNLLSRGNFKKAIEVAEESLKYSKIHLDFYYILCKSYLSLRKFDEADKYFKEYFKLHKKIEGGYIIDDISVNNTSFCSKQEIIKDKIMCDYNREDFIGVENGFNSLVNDFDKDGLVEVYLYSLAKNNKSYQIKRYFESKEITDSNIEVLINILERIDEEEKSLNKINIEEVFAGIDFRLDIYIQCKYLMKSINQKLIEDIDFDNFYRWKGEIFKYAYLDNDMLIRNLYAVKKSEVKLYISYIMEDYICLQKLNKYSKDNFLCSGLENMLLLTTIEEVILSSKSIVDSEYNKLLERAYINKINLISRLYNNEMLNSTYIINVLNKYEYMWIEINKLLKFINSDKLTYIKGLKKLLKEVPEYNKVIQYFLNQVTNNVISKEMLREKAALLLNVQQLIEDGNIDGTFNILNELTTIFKYDVEISNISGIVLYVNGNYKESIEKLALANTICQNNFDTVYNLACVLEAVEKFDEAKKYYLEAYNLTNNKEYRSTITEILKNIRSREMCLK